LEHILKAFDPQETPMDHMDKQSIEHNWSVMDRLIVGCPMGEAMDDCPARDLRGIPAEKRKIEVHATVTPEQVEDIVVRHRQCLSKRLADLPSL
jgi:hypothetical protein